MGDTGESGRVHGLHRQSVLCITSQPSSAGSRGRKVVHRGHSSAAGMGKKVKSREAVESDTWEHASRRRVDWARRHSHTRSRGAPSDSHVRLQSRMPSTLARGGVVSGAWRNEGGRTATSPSVFGLTTASTKLWGEQMSVRGGAGEQRGCMRTFGGLDDHGTARTRPANRRS